MQKYIFKRYDPEYKDFFTSEKKKISLALKTKTRTEHVGSTAVDGLGGKGIVDIIIGVAESEMITTKNDLQAAGYEFREKASTPERLFFRIDYPYKKEIRRVHLHLTKLNGKNWKEMIGFRDYLLKHPDIVEQYSKIKKEGVKIAQ